MTDRDPSQLFLLLAALVMATLGVVFAWRRRVRRAALAVASEEGQKTADAEKRRLKAALEEAVKLGTHLADGRPRCQASPLCSVAATVPAPRIVRDEGGADFFRRLFGAPQRYRVIVPADESVSAAVYCDSHGHLAEQEARAELAEIEHGRQIALRDVEARLAHFERTGLGVRLSRLVEAETRKLSR